MAGTQRLHCQDPGFNPWWRNRNPASRAAQPNKEQTGNTGQSQVPLLPLLFPAPPILLPKVHHIKSGSRFSLSAYSCNPLVTGMNPDNKAIIYCYLGRPSLVIAFPLFP